MLERLSKALFVPVVLFAAAFLLSPYQQYLPDQAAGMVHTAPYWFFGIIMTLALILNRGRILLVGIIITAALSSPFTGLEGIFNQWLLYILLPLNLAIILFLPERGLFTYPGLMRLLLLLVQAIAFYFWAVDNPLIGERTPITLLPSSIDWPAALPIQLGFLTSCLVVLTAIIQLMFKPSPLNQGLSGAILGYFLIFVLPMAAEVDRLFLFVVGCLIANGLFRDYYNMAYQDELTGLPQRRALNEQMNSLGRHYSIAMMDIDHFKKFNDTHGHDVGDQVLQLVASKINQVAGGGKSFRFGGEEFTVLFPGKDVEHAAYYLEKVRKAIEEYEMVIREAARPESSDKESKQGRSKGSFRRASKTVSVTISVGVAEKQSRGEHPDEVLKCADQALYKAKKAGRNQLKMAVK